MTSATKPGKGARENFVMILIVLCGALLLKGIFPANARKPGVAPEVSRQAIAGFSLPGMDGKMWKLGDHQGRVVLVNFWATWCPPCNEETPDLVRLAGKYSSQGLDVVGINMDESDAAPIQRFITEYHVPYLVVLATPKTSLPLAVEALPTSVLLDRHGRIAKTYEGAVSEADFQTDILPLLRER